MSEQPATEPVWLFQHRDRTGTIFRAATGIIRMVGSDGATVTMHLLGPESHPLDARNLVAAISHVVGGAIVSVPAVPDGWAVEEKPTRIFVDDGKRPERYTVEEAEALAGRLGSALMHASRATRQATLEAVRAKAEILAGVSGARYDALPSSEQVMWEDAARRDLAASAGP